MELFYAIVALDEKYFMMEAPILLKYMLLADKPFALNDFTTKPFEKN